MEKYMVPQSRESREIFGETETIKMAPRRDQSRVLESRLQALLPTLKLDVIHGRSQKQILNCFGIFLIKIETKKAGKAKDQEFSNKLSQWKCKIELHHLNIL